MVCNIASLSIITISLAPWKLQENQFEEKHTFQQICDSPYFKTRMEKFQQKCVCVCVCVWEREREKILEQKCVCMYVVDDKLCL
jgi:hypothetical protein